MALVYTIEKSSILRLCRQSFFKDIYCLCKLTGYRKLTSYQKTKSETGLGRKHCSEKKIQGVKRFLNQCRFTR